MQIKQPLCITSRLLPGVRIGGAEISIEYAYVTSDDRQPYRWFIDLCDRAPAHLSEFQDDSLSCPSGATLQDGLETLLGFLAAFAVAGEGSESANLFPIGLMEWAIANVDEISTMEDELQTHPGEFIIE